MLPILLLLTLCLVAAPGSTTHAGDPLGIIVIGDAGLPGEILSGNAHWMEEIARRGGSDGVDYGLLLFLGDNFYPIGLNNDSATNHGLIDSVLGPHSRLMNRLGRSNVHAMAGNHDYYCNLIGLVPYGACIEGNRREAAITSWTYHYRYPALVRRATSTGGGDSVDIIIFDSALLLNQPTEHWHPTLDSLERLLRRSAASPGVRWRILAAHHSPVSYGEHGGYRIWSEDRRRVEYLGNCWSDGQDPTKYIEQFFSAQDNCTPQYRRFNDSLAQVIARSGARIQVMLAGHDHNLQLIHPAATARGVLGPFTYIVSGAGAKASRVRSPSPPGIFTSPINSPEEEGRSEGGFTTCVFGKRGIEIRFISSRTGQVLTMGGRTGLFVVDESGQLVGD